MPIFILFGLFIDFFFILSLLLTTRSSWQGINLVSFSMSIFIIFAAAAELAPWKSYHGLKLIS